MWVVFWVDYTIDETRYVEKARISSLTENYIFVHKNMYVTTHQSLIQSAEE